MTVQIRLYQHPVVWVPRADSWPVPAVLFLSPRITCSVFDTALDIVAQVFQEQIGVFSSEIHFIIVVIYILILSSNVPVMPISVLIIHTTV